MIHPSENESEIEKLRMRNGGQKIRENEWPSRREKKLYGIDNLGQKKELGNLVTGEVYAYFPKYDYRPRVEGFFLSEDTGS